MAIFCDARLVHLLYALETKSIRLIHTGDIDIVVILLANQIGKPNS